MANKQLFTSPTKSQLIRQPDDIKTYVFISVELNNLNTGWPCEISAIAIHINEMKRLAHDGSSTVDTFLPRIQDKLTLCLNPNTPFNEHLSTLLKLNNNIIQQAHKRQFDENTVGLLHQFLKRQEAPVCLLSHNGFRIDFPILQLELKKLERSLDSIGYEDLLCADSLWTFKEIDNKRNCVRSIRDDGVSILDMVYYTQNSLFHRYTGKTMPECCTGEEKNLYLLELVCHQLDSFLEHICCKKFCLVNTLSRSKKPVPVITEPVNNSCDDIQSCQTYVYIDLETTGLQDPKITEMCFVAVHKSSLQVTTIGALPRVCDKLLLVVNPQSSIQQIASELSQLTNPLIEQSSKAIFDVHTTLTLAHFLQQQAQPVCLLAHNGNNFDFQVLRSHLGEFVKDFPIFSKIYCSDSLTAIRNLWQNSRKKIRYNKKPSFALKEVYRRCFSGLPDTMHYAESDVSTLIKITNFMPNLISTLENQKTKFI